MSSQEYLIFSSMYLATINTYQHWKNKKQSLLAPPNQNSSLTYTYRRAMFFTRLRKENSFGKYVKL
ncbi:hypothetical protein COD78_29575 [Bacillus cereus]|uniref:Uncharacterized protein n=1 Tax=Bacillus cereus TaxID=1396 RepID=A0A9X6ZDD1_BACCE|nr:hypothetical protein [Bacillus cereus]OTW80973.1 hypothetical protein BK713_17710 [Bacillus thuringiensis serovar jinghongiensis]OTX18771.1 hypothetical protein BK715_09255 [Bacillus thuringiensis serovar japonensis]PDZ20734.1 hypothetical protein CON41_21985 [Bacillus cereus]PDZ79549.1 hypothetical protein CON31_11735 [Bacillus cereus]